MMKNHIISIFSISLDAFAFWVFGFNNGACNFHFVVYIYDNAAFLDYFCLVGVGMLIISIVRFLSPSRQRMMILSWTLLRSIYLSQGLLQLETFPNYIFNHRFHHTVLSIHEKFVIWLPEIRVNPKPAKMLIALLQLESEVSVLDHPPNLQLLGRLKAHTCGYKLLQLIRVQILKGNN